MKIIEISETGNGAHNNQTINGIVPVPDGWAVIPDHMTIPDTFPFVNIEVSDGVVISMTPGVVPDMPPDTSLPEEIPSIWSELDAAYQEGVNTAYDQ